MRGFPCVVLATIMLAAGCEDSPAQIFSPVNADDPPPSRSGELWTQEGEKNYDDLSGGDSIDRARFCDEVESTTLIEHLVTEPIIPDVSLGGLPVWAEGGQPLHADDLIGAQEDGKFCDPTELYSNAFVWGPTQEIIVFFDTETRLVEGIMATQAYLGEFSGDVVVDGTETTVVIQPRERARIGTRKLDEYTSQADQESRPNAWFNRDNVNIIYRMVRQNFFDEPSLPEDFDCVAENRCALLYTAADESELQDTVLWILDSGIQIRYAPDGYITMIYIMPVRTAPFEVAGEIDLGPKGDVSPQYQSNSLGSCSVDLEGMTWSEFTKKCIDSKRTLSRVNFNVFSQRDVVSVEFEGIDFDFQRHTSSGGVFADGEAPANDDELIGINFYGLLSAPVAQFIPSELAERYQVLLAKRLSTAVAPKESGNSETSEDSTDLHPLLTYEATIPDSLSTSPEQIGDLIFLGESGQESWIPSVIAEVHSIYESLSEEDRARVDPMVLNPVFLIEPYVHAVLDAFSLDMTSEDEYSVIAFRTTDDQRWSIGYAYFYSDGVPYRINVQYSLDFGYVSAVQINRGSSELDELYDDLNRSLREAYDIDPDNPYYDIMFASPDAELNPYRLGGSGIMVTGSDLAMETVDVTLETADGSIDLTVPGEHIDDRSGYMRQIRGERYEFIPATRVQLYGRGTLMVYYVLDDGTIGRIDQSNFMGYQYLCDGLYIGYGDDVRRAVEQWRAFVGNDAYQSCELVYNYSEDGFVLDSVVSLTNRMGFVTVAGRAVTVQTWQ